MLNITPREPSRIQKLKAFYNNLNYFRRWLLLPNRFGKKINNRLLPAEAVKLVNAEEFELFTNAASLREFFNELYAQLQQYELLENKAVLASFNKIITHENPTSIIQSIHRLKSVKLLDNDALTQERLNALFLLPNSQILTQILYKLHEISKEQNRQINDQLHFHDRNWGVRAYLFYGNEVIDETELLNVHEITQKNYDQLIQYSDTLFGNDQLNGIWREIKNECLTQNKWKEIISICCQHQANPEVGQNALIHYFEHPPEMQVLSDEFFNEQKIAPDFEVKNKPQKPPSFFTKKRSQTSQVTPLCSSAARPT